MKKFTALLLILVSIIPMLFACSNSEGEVPEGLRICFDNPKGGYIFYAPEGWTVINSGDIGAAKVSRINDTSITFTEIKMPDVSVAEYFEKSLSDLPEVIYSTINTVVKDKECAFGNASGEAYKYVYTYKYKDTDYACMQIIVIESGRAFLFTYTSHGDVTDESSDYQRYLPQVQSCIDAFKFVDRVDSAPAVFEKDDEGYNLVSEMAKCGFSLYLPEDYELIYNDGFVRAKISDSANITLTKATETNVGILDYLKSRKDALTSISSDFTDIKIALATEIDPEREVFKNWKFDVMAVQDEDITFGNLDKNGIISYEYKYTYNEKVYHVYQIMGVDDRNGYVFTYTALDGEYETHLEEIMKIIGKVTFG